MKGVSVMEMGTIIPIVLALLLFFGSVVSALNTVEKKNKQIDLVMSLVQVVDRITETGVLTKEQFDEATDVLKETLPANFFVCVTSYDDSTYRNCTMKKAKPDSWSTYTPQTLVTRLRNRDLISAAFPVTVQVNVNGVPFNEVKRMLVIVWEGE